MMSTYRYIIHALKYIRLIALVLAIGIIISFIWWMLFFCMAGNQLFTTHLAIFIISLVLLMTLLGVVFLVIDRKIFKPLHAIAKSIHLLLYNHTAPTIDEIKNVPILPRKTWAIGEFIQFFYDMQHMIGLLLSLTRLLSSSLDIEEIMSSLLNALSRFGNGLFGCYFHMDTDGYLKVRLHKGFSSDKLKLLRYRPGEGLIGKVYAHVQPIVLNNTAQEGDGFIGLLKEQDGIESIVFLPIVIENITLGVLGIGSRVNGYFIPERVKLLETIVDYSAVALRNAQLYEQLQTFNRRLEAEVSSTTQELTHTNTRLIKKVRELKILYDILMSVSTKLDINEVTAALMEKVADLIDAEMFSFVLYEKHTHSLVHACLYIGQKMVSIDRYKISHEHHGILWDVLESGVPFVSNAIQQIDHKHIGVPESYTVRSLMCLPIKTQFETVGVFCVGNKVHTGFTPDDQRVTQLLVSHLGEVLENILLYRDREKRIEELTMMQKISSTISSSPVLSVTLKNISHIIAETLHIDYCFFHLYNDMLGELVPQAGFHGRQHAVAELFRTRIDDETSLHARVFKTGKLFTTSSIIDTNSMLVLPQEMLHTVEGSLIILPLKVENQIIGVLTLGAVKEGYFTYDHMRIVQLIADQSAIIIDNATLYQKIRDAVKELEKMNAMKNEFIAIVSHELRTPITSIMGFVNILLKGEAGSLNEQQRRFLQITEQSTRRLGDLINDLLDISRIESGRMDLRIELTSLPSLLQNVVDSYRKECEPRHITLTYHQPAALPEIPVDPDRMTQVFKHLLQNAVKFTDNNGSIKVSAYDRGDFIQIDFTDTGVGIDKSHHVKIFDKFYQVDASFARKAGGTGLGLSIVRSIVELHGGKVWLESDLGKGSTFKVIIPKTKNKEEPV